MDLPLQVIGESECPPLVKRNIQGTQAGPDTIDAQLQAFRSEPMDLGRDFPLQSDSSSNPIANIGC